MVRTGIEKSLSSCLYFSQKCAQWHQLNDISKIPLALHGNVGTGDQGISLVRFTPPLLTRQYLFFHSYPYF